MKIQATVTYDITKRRIADLLCCAIEGGSNYWYIIDEFHKPEKVLKLDESGEEEEEEEIYRYMHYPLSPGGSIVIADKEEPEDEREGFTLSLITIASGLRIMAREYPRHFADFIAENDDAITGDVFLQCCLFGELVYG